MAGRLIDCPRDHQSPDRPIKKLNRTLFALRSMVREAGIPSPMAGFESPCYPCQAYASRRSSPRESLVAALFVDSELDVSALGAFASLGSPCSMPPRNSRTLDPSPRIMRGNLGPKISKATNSIISHSKPCGKPNASVCTMPSPLRAKRLRIAAPITRQGRARNVLPLR